MVICRTAGENCLRFWILTGLDDKLTTKFRNTQEMLPYGRQSIDQDDIDAVVGVLKSPWLTTGPKVTEFEDAVALYVKAEYAVAVSSGTAALHCAMAAIGIATGDEVIVPAITFLATANCVVYQRAKPVFADVCPDTLLIDPDSVRSLITANTKAIIAVDYAGQPCDYDTLRAIANENEIALISDACHSLGATYKKSPVGVLADITVFSFHPVKIIAAGEGGMLVTNNKAYVEFSRSFRNHGMSIDQHQRTKDGVWHYEMKSPGYNYRMSDLHAVLGLSQLSKLPDFLKRRNEIASLYDAAFKGSALIQPLAVRSPGQHAWHLYVVMVNEQEISRDTLFAFLREKGIGVNVHYYPVHLQPYYREQQGCAEGDCPVAESTAQKLLSLPLFPAMGDKDVQKVIDTVKSVLLK